MSITFEPAQVVALLEAQRPALPVAQPVEPDAAPAAPAPDPVAIALALREADLREASDDDHFYGPWFGGSRAEGGRPGRGPTAEARRADMAQKVGPENVGVPPQQRDADGDPQKDMAGKPGDPNAPHLRIGNDDPRSGGPEDPNQTHMRYAEAGHWEQKGDHQEWVVDKWQQGRVDTVHKAYYESVVAGIPTSSTPVVYMTGGGPASGKSKGLLENPKVGIPDGSKASHIDPDSAKAAIPEYRRGVARGDKTAANTAHEESSHMAKTATAIALGRGHTVVLDTVGDSGAAKLSQKVAQMRAQGAKTINADYAFVRDVNVAVARAEERAKKTGRYVGEDVIRNGHRDVSQTFQAVATQNVFDQLRLWDTSGERPTLVATSKNGKLVIKDRVAWDAFVAVGAS